MEIPRKAFELSGVALLVLALHAPFLASAFVIDDGNFVDQAVQVLASLAEPYSFTIHLARPQEF